MTKFRTSNERPKTFEELSCFQLSILSVFLSNCMEVIEEKNSNKLLIKCSHHVLDSHTVGLVIKVSLSAHDFPIINFCTGLSINLHSVNLQVATVTDETTFCDC